MENARKFEGLMYHFAFMLLLFFLAAALGFYQAQINTAFAGRQMEQLSKMFSFVKNLSLPEIFLLIFMNNSVKAILSTVSGIFAGIFPACFVFINGYIVGIVYYVKSTQIGRVKALMYLLPHGVIEIPAILLACSYGSWLGLRFIRKLRGHKINLREDFKMAVKACIRTVIPMLLVAAFVETFITPVIVRLI
jgi:stage II sporulation protein M